jgi:predicted Zn-dependent protease
MLLTEKQSKALCARLLGFTRATDAEVSVNSEDTAHLRFAANAFTTSGRRHNVTAQITVWIDGKRGAASTNEIDDRSLEQTVQQAEKLARVSPVDVEYLPTLGSQKYVPVAGYVEATARVSAAQRAQTIDASIQACEKAQVIGAGFYRSGASSNAIATRHGNFNYERRTLVSLAVTARTPDGGSSGYFLRNHFDVNRFDPERITKEAIRKAVESRNPRALEAGNYRVILEAQAVADLLGNFLGPAFDARRAEEGRSAFAAAGGGTKLGQQLFDPRIDVYSDPWHREVPGSADAEDGLPAQKLYLVRQGTLESLVYSRYWATQKQKAPTPGPVNVLMEASGPRASIDEMIKSTDRGLLVGRFWYIRMVDPRTVLLTGLTRDGVWLVEQGRITQAIRNFRFNQSIVRMLAQGNVEMIGASERVGGSEGQGRNAGYFPPLKLREFSFTSQSEAV